MDGVGSVALNYARHLTEKGHVSYLFGPEVPRFYETDPMVIRFPSLPIPFNSPWRVGVTGGHSFRNRLHSLELDIVHAHSPFSAGHEALRYARHRNIPIVATFHSKYREDFMRAVKLSSLAEKMVDHVVEFYDQADEVWVPNDLTGQTLFSYGYKGAYAIVPNGTDMPSVTREHKEQLRKELLDSYLMCGECLTFLFVGQHRVEKNVMLILDALADIRRKGMDFHAFFVGTGPDEMKMRQKAAESGLHDSVVFIGPVYDRKQLASFYAASDLFLFPSLYDNAALTIREASAFRVPTVAVRGATTARGLIERQNAFLIENSAEALASLLLELEGKRDLVRTVGEGALASVYESWEHVIATVDERYRALL